MLLQEMIKKQIIHPPKFVADNTCYLTVMGSEAYAVNTINSDKDIYGFCIPPKDIVFPHLRGEILGFGKQTNRFEQWQEHHLHYKEQEYDFAIFSIVKYFQLAMDNNPNLIDSLFTSQRCVLHINQIGQMVRDNRKKFLHKGCIYKLKGYAYSQLHKIDIKNPADGSKRKESIEKYGMDCYSADDTEFLTEKGWLFYDDIPDKIKIAAINREGCVVFESPNGRLNNMYTGNMYTVEPNSTRCVVTENHNMLVSPCHRNPRTNFSYKYFPSESNWNLTRLSDIQQGFRSWYHVRCSAEKRKEEYPVQDWYLALAGLFISEGTVAFRNKKVKNISLSQTVNGKSDFFLAVEEVRKHVHATKRVYGKETVWTIHGDISRLIYKDFGHGSRVKALPEWTMYLSARQAKILWDNAILGDGYTNRCNMDIYYTSSNRLADTMQAMMISAGFSCVVCGPYEYINNVGFNGKPPPPMWQVRMSNYAEPKAVDFKSKSRVLMPGDFQIDKKHGYPIKCNYVTEHKIVCFDMPSCTLVTRSKGKPAFQGNCKFAYHVVRLLNQCEQILVEGDLDLERNREQLKSIRRGEWTVDQIKEYFSEKEKQLEEAYIKSDLPYGPNEDKIKQLLLNCLEHHYGSLQNAIVIPGKTKSLIDEIQNVLDKYSS